MQVQSGASTSGSSGSITVSSGASTTGSSGSLVLSSGTQVVISVGTYRKWGLNVHNCYLSNGTSYIQLVTDANSRIVECHWRRYLWRSGLGNAAPKDHLPARNHDAAFKDPQ